MNLDAHVLANSLPRTLLMSPEFSELKFRPEMSGNTSQHHLGDRVVAPVAKLMGLGENSDLQTRGMIERN